MIAPCDIAIGRGSQDVKRAHAEGFW
jgi:hypothetical protein